MTKKIQLELFKVEKDIVELREQTKPIAPANSLGRISRMDAINNKSVVEASLRNSLETQQKLQEALWNVDNPDFGICIRCQQPIPLGRIMLMPHVKNCVKCL